MIENWPQRILLTGDTAGGVWTFVIELADGLARCGVDVCLATFGPCPSASQKADAARLRGFDWQHLTSRLEWMSDPWDDLRHAAKWLQDLARQHRPDLVHLNTLSHADLGWHVPVITSAHSCVGSWWSSVKGTPLPSDWRRYRELVESSLRSSDLIAAPSTSALQATMQSYGLSSVDSAVIFDGRSASEFSQAPKEPFLLTVGRFWDEAKNLQALSKIASDLPWPIYIAGETVSPEGFATGCGGCHPLGMLAPPDLAQWYARAAVYVSTAKYEPFGLAILEAALSGCALLLNDIPSLREIWSDAALFCDVSNAIALRADIQAFVDDPLLRGQMSTRARNHALQYTQSRMVQGYLASYKRAKANHEANDRSHACVL